MHKVFTTFVEGVRECGDRDAMQAVMVNSIAAFDLATFTYFSPSGGPRHTNIFISNYPKSWTDHYFARSYDRIDPVFVVARASRQPFRWGKDVSFVDLSNTQRQMFDEATAFGIRNGLTLPLGCSGGSFAALTIVSEDRPAVFRRTIEKTLPVLQLMAVVFHAAVRRKHWLTGLVDGVPLTQREIECLRWTLHGKSAWEIGCILNIRRSTVSFHLENAKLKLGVRTVAQAVARLVCSL